MEPMFVNQILDILLNHLRDDGHNPLNIYTLQTVAQFMIERKDIILRLFEYALECEPVKIIRNEVH